MALVFLLLVAVSIVGVAIHMRKLELRDQVARTRMPTPTPTPTPTHAHMQCTHVCVHRGVSMEYLVVTHAQRLSLGDVSCTYIQFE